jgi:hypothetical protein
MKTAFHRFAAVILAALGFALPASATTFSADYTDLWYNAPAESQSGWGVNVIQQNEIIFTTLFVYGTDGTPRWFVGPSTSSGNGTFFSGPLFTVTGSYFGGPWTGVNATQVGTISFSFDSVTTGSMTYVVNGVSVTKSIVRQGWRNDFLGGNYIGGTTAFGSSCGGNGGILIHGELTVSHDTTSQAISMFVDFVNANQNPGRCTYSGRYSQIGSVGSISNGTYNCTINGSPNAITGTFTVDEIRNTRSGFNGRINGTTQFCPYSGYFGGIKDVF